VYMIVVILVIVLVVSLIARLRDKGERAFGRTVINASANGN
jgi:hypothetical protein